MQRDYVAQDIANLRFGLYERRLEPNLFRIFEQRSIEQASYRADFWIIGSSHVLNVETDRGGMAEVISGDSRALPTDGRIKLVRAVGEHCYHVQVADEFSYRVDLQLLKVPDNDFLLNEPTPANQGILFRMRHCFPTQEDMAESPITVIDVLKADDSGLELKTFHSYVEAPAVVVTRSTIEVVRKNEI